MPHIPCTTIDPLELNSVEANIAHRRERIAWIWSILALLLILTASWLANAFHYYPALRAERFELLNRERHESDGAPDVAYTATPVQANKPLALLAGAIVGAMTAAALLYTLRTRTPRVMHDPGPIETSIRPDYGRTQINVVKPHSVTMYFVRCRGCGKTLRQWERRTR